LFYGFRYVQNKLQLSTVSSSLEVNTILDALLAFWALFQLLYLTVLIVQQKQFRVHFILAL